MKIAIVSPGVVGTALAVRWRDAGHEIIAVSAHSDATRERAAQHLPGVPILDPKDAAASAEVVVLAVPDDAIASTCEDLPVGGGQTVVHLSGAAQLDVLSSAAERGAGVLSLHPLQTFPTVEAALERLPGSPMAVTARDIPGLALGRGLAADAGCEPFDLADEAKPLYHAAAVLASNALIAILGGAEELLRTAGVTEPGVLEALERASFENALALGPSAALTGPAVRGDAGTVARNLEAVRKEAPDLLDISIAITDLALRVGGDRVPAGGRDAVEAVLADFRA